MKQLWFSRNMPSSCSRGELSYRGRCNIKPVWNCTVLPGFSSSKTLKLRVREKVTSEGLFQIKQRMPWKEAQLGSALLFIEQVITDTDPCERIKNILQLLKTQDLGEKKSNQQCNLILIPKLLKSAAVKWFIMKQFLPSLWRDVWARNKSRATLPEPLLLKSRQNCCWSVFSAHDLAFNHCQADARLTSPAQVRVLLGLSLGPRWLLSFSVQDKEYKMLSFASQKHFTSKWLSSGGKRGFIMPDAETCVFKAVSHRVHQKGSDGTKGWWQLLNQARRPCSDLPVVTKPLEVCRISSAQLEQAWAGVNRGEQGWAGAAAQPGQAPEAEAGPAPVPGRLSQGSFWSRAPQWDKLSTHPNQLPITGTKPINFNVLPLCWRHCAPTLPSPDSEDKHWDKQ